MKLVKKLTSLIKISKNMGWRYVSFRVRFAMSKSLGLLKSKYPQNPKFQTFISLNDWRISSARFFFEEKSKLIFPKVKSELLDAFI